MAGPCHTPASAPSAQRLGSTGPGVLRLHPALLRRHSPGSRPHRGQVRVHSADGECFFGLLKRTGLGDSTGNVACEHLGLGDLVLLT